MSNFTDTTMTAPLSDTIADDGPCLSCGYSGPVMYAPGQCFECMMDTRYTVTEKRPSMPGDFIPSNTKLIVRKDSEHGAYVIDAHTRVILAGYDDVWDARRCAGERERTKSLPDDARWDLARYAVEYFEAGGQR